MYCSCRRIIRPNLPGHSPHCTTRRGLQHQAKRVAPVDPLALRLALAHLFITVNRHELKQDIPELTLPMAIRLIQAALERPHLTEAEALRLTNYHLARNHTATESHRKSWLRRHKGVKPKRLL